LSIALAEPTPKSVALAADLPSDRPAVTIEAVTTFDGSMPSGAMYHRLLICGEYSGPSRLASQKSVKGGPGFAA